MTINFVRLFWSTAWHLTFVLLGSCHNVYISVTKPSKDFLHQDGRRLANIQSHDSILWGDKYVARLFRLKIDLNMKNKKLFLKTTGYPSHLHWQFAGRWKQGGQQARQAPEGMWTGCWSSKDRKIKYKIFGKIASLPRSKSLFLPPFSM